MSNELHKMDDSPIMQVVDIMCVRMKGITKITYVKK